MKKIIIVLLVCMLVGCGDKVPAFDQELVCKGEVLGSDATHAQFIYRGNQNSIESYQTVQRTSLKELDLGGLEENDLQGFVNDMQKAANEKYGRNSNITYDVLIEDDQYIVNVHVKDVSKSSNDDLKSIGYLKYEDVMTLDDMKKFNESNGYVCEYKKSNDENH